MNESLEVRDLDTEGAEPSREIQDLIESPEFQTAVHYADMADLPRVILYASGEYSDEKAAEGVKLENALLRVFLRLDTLPKNLSIERITDSQRIALEKFDVLMSNYMDMVNNGIVVSEEGGEFGKHQQVGLNDATVKGPYIVKAFTQTAEPVWAQIKKELGL